MLTFLDMVVTWFLVLLGWLVVSDQQEKGELAKIGYGRISALRETVQAIEDAAQQHHTQAFDEHRMHMIMRKLSGLATEVAHLQRCGFVGAACISRVVELRRSISYQNFGPGEHSVLRTSSDILAGIAVAKDALDRELMNSAHAVATKPHTLRESISDALKRVF